MSPLEESSSSPSTSLPNPTPCRYARMQCACILHVCMYECMYVRYVCMHVCTYVNMYAMCVCMHVCKYAYMWMHTCLDVMLKFAYTTVHVYLDVYAGCFTLLSKSLWLFLLPTATSLSGHRPGWTPVHIYRQKFFYLHLELFPKRLELTVATSCSFTSTRSAWGTTCLRGRVSTVQTRMCRLSTRAPRIHVEWCILMVNTLKNNAPLLFPPRCLLYWRLSLELHFERQQSKQRIFYTSDVEVGVVG